jgi:hypothetical protein
MGSQKTLTNEKYIYNCKEFQIYKTKKGVKLIKINNSFVNINNVSSINTKIKDKNHNDMVAENIDELNSLDICEASNAGEACDASNAGEADETSCECEGTTIGIDSVISISSETCDSGVTCDSGETCDSGVTCVTCDSGDAGNLSESSIDGEEYVLL